MSSRSDTKNEVSTGAGIAIFGVWLGGAGLTTMILLILFVWSAQPSDTQSKALASNGSGWILLLLIAAPMIAAFAATKMILNKDD
ncbi:MAG TPA: hypothetical protein VIM31_02680 [Candidatus Microsaccharimonas sp.]|jgi:hypothetical protein